MSTRRVTSWAFVALAVVTALGCSPPEQSQGGGPLDYQAPNTLVLDSKEVARVVADLPASSPQRSLLGDGRVSRDELEVSWKHLRSCIEADGLTVSGPYLNPITSSEYLYTYARRGAGRAPSASEDAADDASVQRCEQTYWTPLSLIYAANTPQRMSETLASFMGNCMTKANYPTVHATTFDQLVRDRDGTVDTGRLDRANECLDHGIPELFPQLPYFPRP